MKLYSSRQRKSKKQFSLRALGVFISFVKKVCLLIPFSLQLFRAYDKLYRSQKIINYRIHIYDSEKVEIIAIRSNCVSQNAMCFYFLIRS